MPPPPSQPALSGKASFTQRLGYYLLGLAIGLMMVGMIISMRSRAMNQQPAPGSDPSGVPGATTSPAAPAPASPR